jgi:hypothetical protein
MYGRGRRDENGRDYIRWCFADPETAKAFASEFSGIGRHQDGGF